MKTQDNLLTNIVICSWKNYDSHALNIMKDSLKSWAMQQMTPAISPKCPIDYFIIPIDADKFMYCVSLSKEQALKWEIDEIHLSHKDIDEITIFKTLCAHDFVKFFSKSDTPFN